MRTVTEKKISTQARGCLIEAMRRWLMRPCNHVGGNTLTTAWTGLGYETDYRKAVSEGYMVCAHGPTQHDCWWILTEKGASIVQQWLDNGVKLDDFDGWDLNVNPNEKQPTKTKAARP